jgi:hypothetical protein
MLHVVRIEQPHSLAFARQQVSRKETRRGAPDDEDFWRLLICLDLQIGLPH